MPRMPILPLLLKILTKSMLSLINSETDGFNMLMIPLAKELTPMSVRTALINPSRPIRKKTI